MLQKYTDRLIICLMNTEKIKRYSLLEVSLLAMFVMGIILAQLIVKIRGSITLTNPIELPESGLRVALPANPGWEGTPEWRYESSENTMVLLGQLVQRQENREIKEVEIRWQYHLCTPGGPAEEILYKRSEQGNAVLSEMSVAGQNIRMIYAQMISAGGDGRPYFLGIAQLDYGRSIELQVLPHQIDTYYAEKIFRSLAGSMQYTPPQTLIDGRTMMDEFRKSVVTQYSDAAREEAFIIKDTQSDAQGFSYQHLSTLNSGKDSQLKLYARTYEIRQYMMESTLWFNGDEQNFLWQTSIQNAGIAQPRTFKITKQQDSMVKLERNFDKDKEFKSDCHLLPELMLVDFAKYFIASEMESVTVDVISPVGMVVPVRISRLIPEEAHAASGQIGSSIKIDFLHSPNSWEELYFDASGQLLGRYEQQPRRRARLWERTTPAQLKELFGDVFKTQEETTVKL